MVYRKPFVFYMFYNHIPRFMYYYYSYTVLLLRTRTYIQCSYNNCICVCVINNFFVSNWRNIVKKKNRKNSYLKLHFFSLFQLRLFNWISYYLTFFIYFSVVVALFFNKSVKGLNRLGVYLNVAVINEILLLWFFNQVVKNPKKYK